MRRPWFEVSVDVLAYDINDFGVGIAFVGTDVYGVVAYVRNDVMLCSGVDDCDSCAYVSEECAVARKAIIAYPVDVFHGVIDGIIAFSPCGVTCTSVSCAVYDDEAFLGDGWLHASGFTYECYVDVREEW